MIYGDRVLDRRSPESEPATRPSMRAKSGLAALSHSTVGLELTLSILIGLFGGGWLDAKLSSAPALTLAGLFFGLAAGLRAVYRAAVRMRRETETDGFRPSHQDRSGPFALTEREGPKDG